MGWPDAKLEFPKYEVPNTEQLLEAQAHIWSHMFFFINSMSLNSAMQLGIPDIIHSHGKPMTLSQLVDALHIDNTKSQNLYRLMRILIHSKFFMTLNIPRTKSEAEAEEEEFYWLTPSSHLLLRDGPFSLAPLVQLILDPIMKKSFDYMGAWVVSGNHGTLFQEAHGRTFWELVGQESRLNHMFNQGMSCDARLIMHVLLKECKQVFEVVELVVDVGGGNGTAAKMILDTFSGIKCIVFDLLHVVGGLEGTDNLTYIEGDIFNFFKN